MPKRVLITGASGLLGRALEKEATRRGLDVIPLGWDELDITDPKDTLERIVAQDPDLVLNCAAFSRVDGSEVDRDHALRVNRDGARNVALAARQGGALMVQISTDYVFNGRGRSPHRPADPPAPLNHYGISKLAGEEAVRGVGGDWLIVRTSWMFGEGSPGFVTRVRSALAEDGDPLQVVNDQVSRPILPLPAAEYESLAQRPSYSVLDLLESEAVLGRALPEWRESLARFLLGEDRMAIPRQARPSSAA